MKDAFWIAIDGPVAAGKGTVSRLVAQRLGFLYIDTGAMYRCAALLALRNGIDFSQESAIVQCISDSFIDMHNPTQDELDGRLTTVMLDDEDVSWAIRTEEVGIGASAVAKLGEVRKVLVKKQQYIAEGKNVVMEGRDITYRVLPDAQMKIYLTATDVVRAKRRHFQLLSKGSDVSFDDVYHDLVGRDKQDMSRKHDPLKIVPEAWVIDSTDLAIDKVVDVIATKAEIMMETNHE